MLLTRLPGLIVPATLAVGGGAVFSQFPEFYQQYLQRLGGRLDQAELRVAEIEADADSKGMSLEAYIQTFLDSPQHALEGQRMHDSLEMVQTLRHALAGLADARIWERPALFAKHFHGDTAEATYAAFAPALPLTLDGAAYAGTGAAIALLLFSILRRRLRRRHLERART